MKLTTMQETINETERFLVRARAALNEMEMEIKTFSATTDSEYHLASGVIMASCRRASMDLTRVLAKLRQNM